MTKQNHIPKRGDILIVRLGNPVTTGKGDTLKEQAGDRPAVVISSDSVLLPSLLVHRMLSIVPGTTTNRNVDTHFAVAPNPVNNLSKITYFMAEQVRSIDVLRVIRPVGSMTTTEMNQLDQLIRWCFDL